MKQVHCLGGRQSANRIDYELHPGVIDLQTVSLGVVSDTHPAIITRRTWELARMMRERQQSSASQRGINPRTGLATGRLHPAVARLCDRKTSGPTLPFRDTKKAHSYKSMLILIDSVSRRLNTRRYERYQYQWRIPRTGVQYEDVMGVCFVRVSCMSPRPNHLTCKALGRVITLDPDTPFHPGHSCFEGTVLGQPDPNWGIIS